MGIYTDLFLTFAKIGSFTIGGGFAMVQMMEKEVVISVILVNLNQ